MFFVKEGKKEGVIGQEQQLKDKKCQILQKTVFCQYSIFYTLI